MEIFGNNSETDSPAEPFGNVPQRSESFRTIPHSSEPFGTIPQDAESFRSVPHGAERRENHTLTVRDAVRLFEAAGVARAERSIVNWCQPNRQGIARLDAYLDPNERRYFITSESVDRAIQEELAKKPGRVDQPMEKAPPTSDSQNFPNESTTDSADIRELEFKLRDLDITNRAKDQYIGRLEKDRGDQVKQLMELSHKVGKLETQLRQLEGPRDYDRMQPIDPP